MQSQNGYPVLATNRTTGALPRLRKWVVPGTDRYVYLRDGSAGFLLVHVAAWFHENVEPIDTGVYDDWGWAVRPVRGQSSGYSNHAAGCAVDLNATKHPRGVAISHTFSPAEVAKIHTQLRTYDGCIRWGGDYHTSQPDGMHFEIVKDLAATEKMARALSVTTSGQQILAANPGAADVIWDGKPPTTPRTPVEQPKPAPKPVALPMPAATQRAHAAVAWKGDSLTGLADVATVPLGADGIRAADRNFQWAWENPAAPVTDVPGHGNAFAMHWATPGQNNFMFIVDSDHVRAMTPDELARPILRWPAADVRRWRRTADPASERPATYSEMVNEAVRLGVVICAELKSTAFEYPGPAKQLVQTAKKAGHPPWYMALYKSMGGCKEKCAAVVGAGGSFAVIFGTFQAYRPLFKVAVLTWPVKPTRVW